MLHFSGPTFRCYTPFCLVKYDYFLIFYDEIQNYLYILYFLSVVRMFSLKTTTNEEPHSLSWLSSSFFDKVKIHIIIKKNYFLFHLIL